MTQEDAESLQRVVEDLDVSSETSLICSDVGSLICFTERELAASRAIDSSQ